MDDLDREGLEQRVLVAVEPGDELIARAKVVVVAVKAGRAVRLPRAVIAALGR